MLDLSSGFVKLVSANLVRVLGFLEFDLCFVDFCKCIGQTVGFIVVGD